MKLMPLLQHGSKSPEVDKANESKHDKNETRQKVPENEDTWMLCLSTAVSWPYFIFTVILRQKFSGPYLPIWHYIHQVNPSYENKPNDDNSCSVFLSSQ